MNRLSLGVMARSLKENERRLPLHTHHLGRIPHDLRDSVYLERGYGDRFGMADDQLKGWVAGFRTREQLVEECDVILQPKPLLNDVAGLLRHPQLAARDRWTKVDSPVGPVRQTRPVVEFRDDPPRLDAVPALGEHNAAILAELGYSRDDVERLRADGSLPGPTAPQPTVPTRT